MDTAQHRFQAADQPAWFFLRHKAACAVIILIVVAWLECASLILGFFPWQTDYFPQTRSWQIVALAKLFGAAVPILLLVQVALISRVSWLCRIFSLPGLIHAHRMTALIIISAITAHLLLLGFSGEYPLLSLEGGMESLPRLGGVVAFALLGGGIGTGFFREKLSIPYNFWFRLHGPGMGIAITLLYAHIFTVGYIYDSGLTRWILVIFFSCQMAFIFRLKVLKPRRLALHPWRVASIGHPAPDILKLTLKKQQATHFTYLPGQFVCVRFFAPDIPKEEHPFTLASSPANQDCITLFIKQCGDYTNILHKLVPGITATVDGPFGVFSPSFHAPRSAVQPPRVMIAGGIGITPFISMIRESTEYSTPPPTLLIWSVATREDLFFKQEFEQIQQTMPQLHLYFHITRNKSHRGSTGRLSSKDLETLLAPWRDATIFICGPKPMTMSLQKTLRNIGFSKQNLITERFSL